MPQGVPLISVPSAEKQDLNQLQVDMPKWKPWLSDQSWEEWTHFLEHGNEKLYQVPSVLPEWPLETLKGISDPEDKNESRNHSHQGTILLTKERQECLVSFLRTKKLLQFASISLFNNVSNQHLFTLVLLCERCGSWLCCLLCLLLVFPRLNPAKSKLAAYTVH